MSRCGRKDVFTNYWFFGHKKVALLGEGVRRFWDQNMVSGLILWVFTLDHASCWSAWCFWKDKGNKCDLNSFCENSFCVYYSEDHGPLSLFTGCSKHSTIPSTKLFFLVTWCSDASHYLLSLWIIHLLHLFCYLNGAYSVWSYYLWVFPSSLHCINWVPLVWPPKFYSVAFALNHF